MKDQFMAICTETQEHDDKEYPLSAWLDDEDEASEKGKEHERNTRGHRWRIAKRSV